MAIPQAHLVAFCGDIGLGAATGATMLSVLLGAAFISRQFWGAFADRHGGLNTVLAGSAFQAVSIGAFLSTQNEMGLFAVAAGYGFGFSGIIPAYVVSIRDLFPSSQASWRIPLVLFTAMSGMAFGSWFAGGPLRSFRLLRTSLWLRGLVQRRQPVPDRLPGDAPIAAGTQRAPRRRSLSPMDGQVRSVSNVYGHAFVSARSGRQRALSDCGLE